MKVDKDLLLNQLEELERSLVCEIDKTREERKRVEDKLFRK